jgi:hypothetical protein
MKLDNNLLFSDDEFESVHDGSNVKGSYSTVQFVLRLRSDVRKALDINDISFECIQAKSTALHENVHWWQHIGSSFGLILSLSQPSFIHTIREHLTDDEFKVKSLVKFEKIKFENSELDRSNYLNYIINNYYDHHYAQLFAIHNPNLVNIINDRRFFKHIGHCYRFLWGNTIRVISATIDRENIFIQNPDDWISEWNKLEEDKVDGFYVGTPMSVSPIGIREIFEGQARFIQMQYIASALDKNILIKDFEDRGMLHGVYRTAYDLFIQITGLDNATTVIDSGIGIFLLVCDLAINPDNGFPSNLSQPKSFIRNNDPGCRFVDFCAFINRSKENVEYSIINYSKEEYINLAHLLCKGIGAHSSYESIHDRVREWMEKDSVKQLLYEDSISNFSEGNLPIKVLLAKFINFQIDKYKSPHIFCWFGIHGHANSESELDDFITANEYYLKHHCLFTDDYDGEVKPVIFNSVDPINTYKTFNEFYGYALTYDLVMKWVAEEGEFSFDYKWLLGDRHEESLEGIKNYFKRSFNFSIDEIKSI